MIQLSLARSLKCRTQLENMVSHGLEYRDSTVPPDKEPLVKIKSKCPRTCHNKREEGTVEPPSRSSTQEKEENKNHLYQCTLESLLGMQEKRENTERRAERLT